MNLDDLRKEIDECDAKLVELFEQRLRIAGQVADYKLANGKKVYDRERELQKIAAVKALTHNEFNQKGVEELYEQLMSMSRKLQYQKLSGQRDIQLAFIEKESIDQGARVAFQGAMGSYSEAAMKQYFGAEVQSINVDTFRDAMLALDEGSAEYAILPIENSTTGIISEIYDLMVEFEHFIVGEQVIGIQHCLLGVPGTTLDTIETVYSHAQSLMQSEHFLRTHSGWKQISMKNNAFAAAKVARVQDVTQAAIASSYAAKVYGLNILEEGINHLAGNSTRFIIVSSQKVFLKNASKISVCFEIPHESGSLYHILSHFIYNNLNMTKIESRPMEGRNWEYRFFIDFEGNLRDSAVRNALCGIREETGNLRILGNY